MTYFSILFIISAPNIVATKFYKMKSLRQLLLFSIVLTAISCSRNTAPQGHYQSTKIVADGNADEWQLPLRFTNTDYTLSYNITNDTKNVYLILITKDDVMQERILKSGVSIYFDRKGENSKNVSLTYPEKKAYAPRNGKPIIPDSTQSRRTLIKESETYGVKGFYELEDGQFSVKDKRSKVQLGMSISLDSGLVYEAVIPINYLIENGLTDKNLKKTFSIGIVVHSIANTPGRNGNKEYANRSGSGIQPRVSIGAGFGGFGIGGGGIGIGMGGGGMRRRGNYNNQENNPAQPEETLWYQFRFSTKADQ